MDLSCSYHSHKCMIPKFKMQDYVQSPRFLQDPENVNYMLKAENFAWSYFEKLSSSAFRLGADVSGRQNIGDASPRAATFTTDLLLHSFS